VWKLLTQVFGSRNQRLVKELSRTVSAVNALEPSVQALTDEQFPEKTRELRARFAAGTPQKLFEGPYLQTSRGTQVYDVFPDGQRFLMLKRVDEVSARFARQYFSKR